MRSIGAEIKNWQHSCAQDDEPEVTLFNHSDFSAFRRFRPDIEPTIIRATYHQKHTTQQLDRSLTESSEDGEPENLLTSEKTHFSPIILDGHSFVIDNHWDELKYERSPSGSLMIDNKRYMAWKNQHNFQNDCFGHSSSNMIDLEEMEKDESDFIIKFEILDENDKAVQTEPMDLVRTSNRSLLEISEEYCKRKIYDEYFKTVDNNTSKWRYQANADDSNDYSFFSVNRVKPTEPAKTLQDILLSSNSSSSSICTITSSSYDNSTIDPFESWRSIRVDNGGMLDSEYKHACMHNLWEQCVNCERNYLDPYEVKSIPANRMLKDELRSDGEEIMSVIEKLYITRDFCDVEEEKNNDDDLDSLDHFYADMCDDSMDGVGEEDPKFYEGDVKPDDLEPRTFPPSMFEQQPRDDLLQLENFDEITMAQMQYQWERTREMERDYDRYAAFMKLVRMKSNEANVPDSNNNCQTSRVESKAKNRKRRHSTCQNFMDIKTSRSQDIDFAYMSHSPTVAALIEDNANVFVDAKMLKVNLEELSRKILLIADQPHGNAIVSNRDAADNHYRKILQHALIKQMDLARPLTR